MSKAERSKLEIRSTSRVVIERELAIIVKVCECWVGNMESASINVVRRVSGCWVGTMQSGSISFALHAVCVLMLCRHTNTDYYANVIDSSGRYARP